MKRTSFCLTWVFVSVTNLAVINSSPLHGKITHSRDVQLPTQVFYMASIRLLKNNTDITKWYHICGGCLISLQHILTAAQCIILINEKLHSGFEAAAAFVGTLYLDDSTQPSMIKDMEYNNLYDPENVRDTAGYDIGVILLMKELTKSDVVNKVDLYYYEYSDIGIQSALTMGWGALQRSLVPDATFLKTHQLPTKLRFTSLNIMDDFTCFKKLKNLLTENVNLMCAGDKATLEQNSVGDAGNPLIVTFNRKLFVAGVASYISGSKRHHPNVFVHVKTHEAYIHEAMARLSLKAKYCTSIASSSNTNIIATH